MKTLLFVLFLATCLYATELKKKVLLKEVGALVFHRGETSYGRRTDVPQLSCVGGTCPDTVQCKNIGTDGEDVMWDCSTTLPNGRTMTKAQVECEGWSSPNDAYITVGSCSVTIKISSGDVELFVEEVYAMVVMLVVMFIIVILVSACCEHPEPRYNTSSTWFFFPSSNSSWSSGSSSSSVFSSTSRR
jgi:hypothetical protein